MQNRELSRQLQRLRSLFQRTAVASGQDIEMQSHWAKYLCVLSAGFLENALVELFSDFASGAASPPVAQYARKSLSKTQNPKTQKFVETASAFKATWGENLNGYVELEGRKDAIDSIMNNRHLIAHGRDSGISLVRLKEWFDKSIDVIEFLEQELTR